MENNFQSTMPNSLPANSAGNSNRLPATASLDAAAQTGQANVGDWQEEIYQKTRNNWKENARGPGVPDPGHSPVLDDNEIEIQSMVSTKGLLGATQQNKCFEVKQMKDAYLPEMIEMHVKVAAKVQQLDSLPQQPNSYQLDKLKFFKNIVERRIQVLQMPKNSITPALEDKLGTYERQILSILNNNRPRTQVSSMQQGLPQLHVQSLQQPQSQVSQLQSHENPANSQMQSMNLQGSTPTMSQSRMSNLQHNSLPSVSGVASSQQQHQVPQVPANFTFSFQRDNTEQQLPTLPPPPKQPTLNCPICFSPFIQETSTKCGHIFCKTCILSALKVRPDCPTCRRRVLQRELIRVFLPAINYD